MWILDLHNWIFINHLKMKYPPNEKNVLEPIKLECIQNGPATRPISPRHPLQLDFQEGHLLQHQAYSIIQF